VVFPAPFSPTSAWTSPGHNVKSAPRTHHTYFDAVEWGLNVVYAGHYATETLGVQALASHLGERFDLEWEFHDHPTGL
jgi:hypothetical protein